MNRILCSTGCLIGRPNGRNYHLLQEYTGDLQCDGLEFMMYEDWYQEMEELIAYLKCLSLDIPVMHCQKSVGELLSREDAESRKTALKRFEMNCRVAGQIGAQSMVMHLWDGVTSDRYFERNLAAYGELRSIAQEYKIELWIENVVCNQKNPMLHWKQLAERYEDVRFVFDTKMAAFHEQMELLYAPEFRWLWEEHHIRHFHVNDYSGGYMEWDKLKTLPIGAGHIDFERFFAFLKQMNYQGMYTVEATAFRQDGTVNKKMLNDCFSQIHHFLES